MYSEPLPAGWKLLILVILLLDVPYVVISGQRPAYATPTVTASQVVEPGSDLQALVDASPAGTEFILRPGTYHLQEIVPKDGNAFIGDAGAVLSGARTIDAFRQDGRFWIAEAHFEHRPQVHGVCDPGHEGCKYSEDLFLDDVMLEQVTSLADLRPGKWYFDLENDALYLSDDPTDRRIELSSAEHAFYGDAIGVHIRGLILEKYATPAQDGAIHGKDDATGILGAEWVVQGNEIRLNHGGGIRLGRKMRVIDNYIHHNGQIGLVGGESEDILVEHNEISFNNLAGFDSGWEAGGAKFVRTRGLVVRGNYVHDNHGPGLWTDIDNVDTLYEVNVVEHNEGIGIFHEISYDAVIRNNVVTGNGSNHIWLWGAGIAVAASPNVEVYGNVVSKNLDGIAAIQQDRGMGGYGPLEISNLYVHNNIITMDTGQTGLVQDVGDDSYFSDRGNRFERNSYYLASEGDYFAWLNVPMTSKEWIAGGNDTDGEFHQKTSAGDSAFVSARSLVVIAGLGASLLLVLGTLFVIKSGRFRRSPTEG